ncbi:MAG: 50S ribosomal protein L30 [Christensenellaceae bacterium]|nr:50S ribosomal protein L30 [Christensenellaceae bacterium]
MTVTLIKSTNGCTVRQIRTVQALGLKKINDAHVHQDNPAIRGMCAVVPHLVKIEK